MAIDHISLSNLTNTKEKLSTDNDIIIYPNPTKGQINIEVLGNEPIQEVQILDIQGRLLGTVAYHTAPTKVRIDLPKASGVYLIKVMTREAILLRKVLKR